MIKWRYKVVFVIFALNFQTRVNSRVEKGYGETCDNDIGEICSAANGLVCMNGICNCLSADEMIYDELSKKCLALFGHPCGERSVSLNFSEMVKAKVKKRSKSFAIQIDCVEDSICVSGVCKCMDNFFVHGKLCQRRLKYGEPCSNSEQCESSYSKALICTDGVCQCDPMYQTFDTVKGKCVGLIGTDCNLGAPNTDACYSNAECNAKGRCQCEKGFSVTTRRSCGLGHGQICGRDKECGDLNFACFNGVCKCKNPNHMVYDAKMDECLSIVSGPCTSVSANQSEATPEEDKMYIQKCIRNAECIDRKYYSECECKVGYVQTKEGLCAPGFGEVCGHGKVPCDPITPLHCKNGRCQCLDDLTVYDPVARACVGLVGSRCQNRGPCVEFATCVQVDGPEVDGKCLCDKYATLIQNRTCTYKPRY